MSGERTGLTISFSQDSSRNVALCSFSLQIYSLSRDGALPLSSIFYNMDTRVGGPVRSIWLVVVLAFILGE